MNLYRILTRHDYTDKPPALFTWPYHSCTMTEMDSAKQTHMAIKLIFSLVKFGKWIIQLELLFEGGRADSGGGPAQDLAPLFHGDSAREPRALRAFSSCVSQVQ